MGSVFLIRHGTTAYNRGGVGSDRIRSHADVPLTDVGRQEGKELAHQLQNAPIKKIYTSDLSRASDTARMIEGRLAGSVPIVATKKLRSWDMGELTGKLTSPSVVRQIKAYVRDDNEAPKDGESFRAFTARLIGYVEPLFRAAEKGPSIAIVTHGRCAQVIDLWARSGCDEDCMHRDYATELSSEPDKLDPGGYLELRHTGDEGEEPGHWLAEGATMALVDMKLTPEEADDQRSVPASSDRPAYPYGLSISLDKAALDKLGLDDDEAYEPGTTCKIMAEGVVTGFSLYKNQDGTESRSLQIQITALGVVPETSEDDDEGHPSETPAGKAVYGRKSPYRG